MLNRLHLIYYRHACQITCAVAPLQAGVAIRLPFYTAGTKKPRPGAASGHPVTHADLSKALVDASSKGVGVCVSRLPLCIPIVSLLCLTYSQHACPITCAMTSSPYGVTITLPCYYAGTKKPPTGTTRQVTAAMLTKSLVEVGASSGRGKSGRQKASADTTPAAPKPAAHPDTQRRAAPHKSTRPRAPTPPPESDDHLIKPTPPVFEDYDQEKHGSRAEWSLAVSKRFDSYGSEESAWAAKVGVHY
jgi:hypothetical protein